MQATSSGPGAGGGGPAPSGRASSSSTGISAPNSARASAARAPVEITAATPAWRAIRALRSIGWSASSGTQGRPDAITPSTAAEKRWSCRNSAATGPSDRAAAAALATRPARPASSA